ncbi:MAG: hypothetical protein EZS28_053239 [Streblomastix strix]|uniref:Uncharacterized protein n=1 Tax=Streblomastix strix TaxID=222440 RepID=A0A5J4RIY5_9EUKA|nr:MAG: hypothetical protein EZS28_053239 [Streblomastix strix]
MSSDEFEPNNRLNLTTFQQPIFKIYVINKMIWGNYNRHFQLILKKIKEEQIEVMIIVPLWLGQIGYTELVNENAQSLMLGWSNEILEPGTSLIKKNLKLPAGKICCFLMDRRPVREEDS